jgi:DNA repair protein RadC
VRIVRDRTAPAPYQIKSPADVAATLRELVTESDREIRAAIVLDTKNHILAIDPIAVGSLDAALITMREVFKTAIILGAAAIILAHNHPSCVTTPSPEDELLTREAIRAGKLLDIQVLDHVILASDGRWTSLRERGGAYWK